MLLYASGIWGTMNTHVNEAAHNILFVCKRLLDVRDKNPNNLIYGETGKYPLFVDSTINSFRYWLNIANTPLNQFPGEAFRR